MVRVWADVDAVPADLVRTVVAVGVFDGVHRGHRALLGAALERARTGGLPCVVLTFDPHPAAVLRPGGEPVRLTSIRRRVQLLGELGVDAVLVLRFDADRAAQTADEFVDEVLVARLHAAAVYVGENFRFGRRAAGDVALLARRGAERGFEAHGVPLAPDSSSTAVRRLLAEGDVSGAAAVLGRPHRLEGVVVHGDQRGRELGYPTANVDLPDGVAVPPDGVYAGWLVVGPNAGGVGSGGRLPAAVSVGTNPTFDGVERRVEAYAIDRTDLDLYGREVAVEFTHRLRGQVRYEGIGPLVAQMALDVDRVRELLTSS